LERRIDLSNLDLDRAGDAVVARRDAWADQGLTLDPLTWLDNETAWPRPVLTDRSEVRRPMSLRVVLRGHEGSLAEVTLYAGGWADVLLAAPSSSEIEAEYHELDEVEAFGPLLDGVASATRHSRLGAELRA
jgi:hypothetical protein